MQNKKTNVFYYSCLMELKIGCWKRENILVGKFEILCNYSTYSIEKVLIHFVLAYFYLTLQKLF